MRADRVEGEVLGELRAQLAEHRRHVLARHRVRHVEAHHRLLKVPGERRRGDAHGSPHETKHNDVPGAGFMNWRRLCQLTAQLF